MGTKGKRTAGPIRSVTVYCSSSNHIALNYRKSAIALGKAIAAEGWSVVYGGGRGGLMGLLADAAHSAGGRVIGISPQFFVDGGHCREDCHEFIIAADMRHRKSILQDRGDAFVVLPGGLGTFDEVFEILCYKSLGLHGKPIVLVNIAGFFDPLLKLIEHGIDHRFIKAEKRDLIFVAESVDDAVGFLKSKKNPTPPNRSARKRRSA